MIVNPPPDVRFRISDADDDESEMSAVDFSSEDESIDSAGEEEENTLVEEEKSDSELLEEEARPARTNKKRCIANIAHVTPSVQTTWWYEIDPANALFNEVGGAHVCDRCYQCLLGNNRRPFANVDVSNSSEEVEKIIIYIYSVRYQI